MGGSILQLVSRGAEDLIITGDPEITFFKAVYRRHVNFSIYQKILNFAGKTNFNKRFHCKIKRLGDLLTNLTLVVDLPRINIKYKLVTNKTIYTILKNNGINWLNGNNINIFGSDEYANVSTLITQKISSLESELETINNVINIINNYDTNQGNDDYYDGIIDSIMNEGGTFNTLYDEIVLFFNNNYLNREMWTFERVIEYYHSIFKKIALELDEDNQYVFDSMYSIMNKNLNLIDLIDGLALNITSSDISIKDQIKNKVILHYEANQIDSTEYTKYDSYIILNNFLEKNNSVLSNNFDPTDKLELLTTTMNIGLLKNIQLLKQALNVTRNTYKFFIYKRYKYDTTSTTYNGTETFINNSIIDNTIMKIDDNFSNTFVTPAYEGDPGVTHFFKTYIDNKINVFHNTLTNLFSNSLYNDYFENETLWTNLEIPDTYTWLSNDKKASLENVLSMNYIPSVMIVNIIQSVINIRDYYSIRNPNDLTQNLSTSDEDTEDTDGTIGDQNKIRRFIDTKLYNTTSRTYKTDIFNIIDSNGGQFHQLVRDYILTGRGTTNDISNYIALTNNKIVDNDILNITILRRIEPIVYNETKYEELSEYVCDRWINELTILKNEYNNEESDKYTITDTLFSIIIDIINSYRIDVTSDNFPTYVNYINGFSIGRVKWDSNIIINPLPFAQFELTIINEETDQDNRPSIGNGRYVDAASCIYLHIRKQFKIAFNNFFNVDIIDNILTEFGAEGKAYFDNIINDILDTDNYSILLNDNTYDFYNISDELINIINQTDGEGLIRRASQYELLLERYTKFKFLLDIKNELYNKQDLLYTGISTIRTKINEFIYKKLLLTHSDFTQIDDILTIKLIKNTDDIIQNGGIDIYGNTYIEFIGIDDITGSFTLGNNIKNYIINKYGLNSTLLDLYNTLNITKNTMYLDKNIVLAKYNRFYNSDNIKDYILNKVQKNSFVNAGIISLKMNSVIETKNNILEYFINKKNNIITSIDTLHNTVLSTLLNYSKGNMNANFAWIQRIGHFLFKEISILIGGQKIDLHTGDILEILRSLQGSIGTDYGYNKMTGHTPELFMFNNLPKEATRLYIPLQFWFCKYFATGLPLVNLIHTDIVLSVQTRSFEQLAYYQSEAEIIRKPRIKCKLIADYVYVEKEERKRLANSKLEYLIETIQIDDGLIIDKNFFQNNETEIIKKVYFKNPTKEFIWAFRDLDDINGSLMHGQKKWNKYYYQDSDYNIKDVFSEFSFNFNGREREKPKSAKFYNYVQSYGKRTGDPPRGVYSYTFSIYPEKYQPSGTANLSMIELFELKFKFSDEMISLIKSGKRFQLILFGRGYNVLRCISGMSGLIFYEP